MSLLWGLVIIVVVDAIAITAMLLVRRRAPEGSFFADGDRASGVFGVLATCFAIFAGFVIFLAFTTYDQSLAGADAEALIVVAAVRDGAVPPDRDSQTHCRARSSATPATVVDQEWPEMRAGVTEQRDQPVERCAVPHDPRRQSDDVRAAGGLRQVARPDLGSGGSASRPHPRRGRDHADDRLDRPPR